jgi:hypothetical protein
LGSAGVIRSPGKPAEEGFIMKIWKKRGDVGANKTSDNNKNARQFRTCVQNTKYFLSKMVKTEVLFISCFSSNVSVRDVAISLMEQLKRFSPVCTRLNIKFKIHASLDISLIQNDFPIIYSPGLWTDRCLFAPVYGRLNLHQIFSSDSQVTSTTSSPGTDSNLAVPASGPAVLTDETRGGDAVSLS